MSSTKTIADKSMLSILANAGLRNEADTEGEVAHKASRPVVTRLPISMLREQENVRTEYSEAELDELSRSIVATGGLLQPVVVSKTPDGTYSLLFGYRRYRACLRANLKQIDCIIRDPFKSVAERQLIQGIENLQRANLTNLEEEILVNDLLKEGLSQTDIANALHKSLSWVTKRIGALEAREMLGDALKEKGVELATETAYHLSKASDDSLDGLLEKIKAGDAKGIQKEIKETACSTNKKSSRNALFCYSIMLSIAPKKTAYEITVSGPGGAGENVLPDLEKDLHECLSVFMTARGYVK